MPEHPLNPLHVRPGADGQRSGRVTQLVWRQPVQAGPDRRSVEDVAAEVQVPQGRAPHGGEDEVIRCLSGYLLGQGVDQKAWDGHRTLASEHGWDVRLSEVVALVEQRVA